MRHKGRREYLQAVYDRYRSGTKGQESNLERVCASTGYNLQYAIRLLNEPRPDKPWRSPLRRGVSYGQPTLDVLIRGVGGSGLPSVS